MIQALHDIFPLQTYEKHLCGANPLSCFGNQNYDVMTFVSLIDRPMFILDPKTLDGYMSSYFV